jgi:hypothetical protein
VAAEAVPEQGTGAQPVIDRAVTELTAKASFDGQCELGVAIYELAGRQAQNRPGAVELVFDSCVAPRMVEVSVDDRHERGRFWMNEDARGFCRPTHPGAAARTAFACTSKSTPAKRLLITAEDLRTCKLVFDRTPVVKLT